MLDLPALLTDEVMARRFDWGTLHRGRDLARRGLVLSCESVPDPDGDLQIVGRVTGSEGRPYSTRAQVIDDEDGLGLWGTCTCPVHRDCKHAVALLIQARDTQAPQTHGPSPAWERQLSSLLDELDARSDATARTRVPLALQVELAAEGGAGGWSPGRRTVRSGGRGALRVRPLRPGARDNWIKSQAGWNDLRQLERMGADPRQLALLDDLLTMANRASPYGYYNVVGSGHVHLGDLGPDGLRLLGQAPEVGLTLIPGRGISGFEVLDPVTVEVDVTRHRQGTRVRAGVSVDGEWYDGDDLDVLGQHGHGVVLWRADERDWHVRVAPLTAPLGPELRRLVRQPHTVVVPQAASGDLLADYLPQLQRHVAVRSFDGSVHVPERPLPRLRLTVTWVTGAEVGLTWTWHYRVGSEDRVYALSEARGARGVRRPDAERELLDGLRLDEEQRHHLSRERRPELGLADETVFRDEHAVVFAQQLLPVLRELADADRVEIEEVGGQPDFRELAGEVAVSFTERDPDGVAAKGDDADGRVDWLDLEVTVTVDGVSVGLGSILEALTDHREMVVLPDGRFVRVDRPEFARLAELVAAAAELRDQPDGGVRVAHRDLDLWDELAEVGIVEGQAAQWVAAAQSLRSFADDPPAPPIGLKAELRSYQHEGFGWLVRLWEARLGGILADDMGLGKTLQTLALVAHARERGAAPFVVVAPTSVVSAWASEAEHWTPDLVCRTVTESQSRRGTSIRELADGADLVVTSYTLFRLEQADYVGLTWGGLVLDEAQTVKNHRGKTYQAIRRLDVPFRLALSGTPMENRLMELWSLLSIVAPGLYPWPTRFAETVAVPVEKLGDADALARFRKRMRPFLLRRTKDLVAADLPPKQEQVLDVRLTPRHRTVYDTHLQRERQSILGLLDDFDEHRIAIFRALTRLRQLSLDAALVDEAYAGIGSAKIDVLVDHLLEVAAEGHRALVFSQFTSFLARVRARLDREGIASSYLDGTTRHRPRVIDAFKRGDDPVFLISLKAGGVGLTLTEADYVFVLDPWWNPAVEAQAVDRTHRIGQTRPVNVYRLVATDTIEEKVMALKARKAALFAKVIDGDGMMATAFGAEDVRALLGE